MKQPSIKAVALFCILLSGCESANKSDVYDPFESVNREVFAFNHSLDKHAALPAASYYKHAVPDGMREGVHNVLSNLGLPVTFANDVLQGHFSQAGYAVCRFGVNTTVGVLGIMDRATAWGCVARDEDFGQTLAVYGVPGGPYLVLPLLGSSFPRDMAGKLLVDHYFNPLGYVAYNGKYYVTITENLVKLVDNRSRAVGALRDVERNSIDYYATMRSLYAQKREAEIEDKPFVPKLPAAPAPLAPEPPTK